VTNAAPRPTTQSTLSDMGASEQPAVIICVLNKFCGHGIQSVLTNFGCGHLFCGGWSSDNLSTDHSVCILIICVTGNSIYFTGNSIYFIGNSICFTDHLNRSHVFIVCCFCKDIKSFC
jgi:hypothetical protein